MSDDKPKVGDKAGEIAKNIWLAGVGAYGKAVEDAQGRIEKAMEPPKLFKDLVKAGSALEDDAREALESTMSARQSVEERIHRVRENFHLQRTARVEDVTALEHKVDKLSKQVAALTKALQQQGLAVKPERKTTAAKKSPASKTTAKKPTAGRTAAKKVSATKAAKKKAPEKKRPTKRGKAKPTARNR